MARAFVAVGSNVRAEANVRRGLARLRQVAPVVAISTFYRTPPWDRPEQEDFVNGVVVLETGLSPSDLRERLREIEAELGRVRTADKSAARTLDLDLIAYEGAGAEAGLPEPEIAVRPFLAVPLAELAPRMRLPGESPLVAEIAEALDRTRLSPLQSYTEELRKDLGHEP